MKKSKRAVKDVTERKRAEEALASTKAYLESSLESAPDGVLLLDKQTRFSYVNPTFLKWLDRRAEDFIGKTVSEISPPIMSRETTEIIAERVKKRVETGEAIRGAEVEIIGKDGKPIQVSYSAAGIRDGKGDIIGEVVFLRDITKRKRAEDALQQRTHDLGERVKELGCLYGLSKLASEQDRTVEKILQETVKLVPPSWQHPDITCAQITYNGQTFRSDKFRRSKWAQKASIIVSGKKAGAIEVFYEKKMPTLDEGPFLKEERRLIDALAERIEGIIEHKRAEEELKKAHVMLERRVKERTAELRESEEKFKSLAEESPNMIFINKEGRVVYANKKCEEVMGYTREEIYAPDFDIMILHTPESQKKVKQSLKTHKKGKEVAPYEYTLLTKDGEEIEAIITSKLIQYGGDTAILGILTDITERKRAEEELRHLMDSVPDVVMIVDSSGKIHYVNHPAAGLKAEEVVGSKLYDFLPPGEKNRMKGYLKHVLKTGEILDYEILGPGPKGTTAWYESRLIPLKEEGPIKNAILITKDITERRQAEEALLRKFLRYRLKKGEVYLIKEQNPDLSIEVFKDMLNCGFAATVFSRAKKEEIESTLGEVKSFWLAESSKAKDAIEPRFSEIESRIKTIEIGNNAVLLDRMDYLISKNGFDDTLKFVQRLFEQAYYQKLIVILTLDPKTLSPRELRRLEKETKRVEPKVRSRLPEDIHEILKFVYSENRIGKYPSYKDIHEKFEITRTTGRNRIKRLKTMKFLVDRKKGRTKFLEVTDEGREQF